jgi:hypothetical protein
MHIMVNRVSILPTTHKQLCHTEITRVAFLKLLYLGGKSARKKLVKLTTRYMGGTVNEIAIPVNFLYKY